jgi:hypothetical protein
MYIISILLAVRLVAKIILKKDQSLSGIRLLRDDFRTEIIDVLHIMKL